MKKKIKILYFMDGIGNAGGIQEMVLKWLENMNTNEIQVDILSYNTGKIDNYPERFEKFGGKIHIVQTYISKKYFIKSFKDLYKFFNENRDYDILHAHASSKAIFVMLFAKIYGIKTRILHSHCTQFIMKGKISLLIANLFKPLTNFLTTDYYACSLEAGIFLFGKKAIEQGKVTIAHNAIKVSDYKFNEDNRKNIRRELGIENNIVIGHVGRFRPQKNHDYLIDIFKEINNIENNSVLLLVGNGELEKSIKEKVKRLGIEKNVIFLGFRTDINRIMQGMDILVMPSIFEGLPVTCIEAQAEGLPCVFSDTITKDAAILKESVYINLETPPNKWAEIILDITKNYKRRDTTEIIQKHGYDIALESKKIEEFYKYCLMRK